MRIKLIFTEAYISIMVALKGLVSKTIDVLVFNFN